MREVREAVTQERISDGERGEVSARRRKREKVKGEERDERVITGGAKDRERMGKGKRVRAEWWSERWRSKRND